MAIQMRYALSFLISIIIGTSTALATPLTLHCEYSDVDQRSAACTDFPLNCTLTVTLDPRLASASPRNTGAANSIEVTEWSDARIIFRFRNHDAYNAVTKVAANFYDVFEVNRYGGEFTYHQEATDRSDRPMSEDNALQAEPYGSLFAHWPQARQGKCVVATHSF